MAGARYWGCIALLLSIACGSEGPSGPALLPRPDVQTCLADFSEGMPARLSETGCFVGVKALEPGPDLIPYEVNSALWTDGAFKPRFMVVPSPEKVSIHEDGSWGFPEGSVLIKSFGFEFEGGSEESRRPLETRFMLRTAVSWEYATYEWNDEGTDALLLDGGKSVEYTLYRGDEATVVEYTFPGHDACTTCHGAGIGDVLGPKTSQLNRRHDYDGVVANQLTAMNEIDLLAFDGVEELDPETLPRMASPQMGEGTLEDQARAYLGVNCAHCHQPGGWAPDNSGLDFLYETRLEDTGLCEPMKYFEWVGRPRVDPGNPEGSGLIQRFLAKDPLRMPSLGTSLVDADGVALLSQWISELRTCP